VLILLVSTAAAALAVLLVAFAIGAATGRHNGVDVAWGVGFAAVALTAAALTRHPMSWLVAALTAIWGLRLAIHIGRRAIRPGTLEDPRYEELLSRAKGNRLTYAFRMIYLLQAVSLWFVALPVVIACRYAPLTGWAAIGIALWVVGLFFEGVGDWQLGRFRDDPAMKGRVLDTGLWRYTRHPNYFGDACVWWGMFALSALHWTGWLTVLSPLLMTYLLTRRTGKPLMEKHLSSSRPGYADYVARTSGFVPRPPRPHARRT
jgi:steroid 5-alpha reductase family enzyme